MLLFRNLLEWKIFVLKTFPSSSSKQVSDDMFVWCCRDSMGAVLCMSSIYCKTRPISVHSWKECACLLVKRRQSIGEVRGADGAIFLSLQIVSTIMTRLSIFFCQSHHDSYFKGCQLRIDTPLVRLTNNFPSFNPQKSTLHNENTSSPKHNFDEGDQQ